jgi:hypothetical protein
MERRAPRAAKNHGIVDRNLVTGERTIQDAPHLGVDVSKDVLVEVHGPTLAKSRA